MDEATIHRKLDEYCRKTGSYTHYKSEWTRILQNINDSKALDNESYGPQGLEEFRKLKSAGFFAIIGAKVIDSQYAFIVPGKPPRK